MSSRRDLLSSGADAFPRVFGTYLLLAPLGKGGMGEVFLAKRRLANGMPEVCVVKTLRQDLGQDREYVTRFIDEARVVVTLNHPNICHVFDVGKSAEGQYYLGMEYLSGLDAKTLGDRAVELSTSVPTPAAVQIAIDVLAALDYAHKRNHPLTGEPLELIHRDVSPHNVVVGYDGISKLIDFGLASSRLKIEQTAPNVVMGKMAYMGPEQARGDAIDARADQFAAAMVLYELLSGERFYEGLTPNEIWNTVGKGGFRPRKWKDATDKQLRGILDKALHKDAKKRYPDCAAFRRVLVEYLHGHFSMSGEDAVRYAITDLAGHDLEDEWERMAGFAEVSLSGFTHELEVTGRLAQVIAQASPDVRPARPSAAVARGVTQNEPTALLPREPPAEPAESTELVDRPRRSASGDGLRARSSSGPNVGFAREPTEVVRDRPGARGDRGVIVVHPSQALHSPRQSKPLVALVAGLSALLLLAVGALFAVVFFPPDDAPDDVLAGGEPAAGDGPPPGAAAAGDEPSDDLAGGPTGRARSREGGGDVTGAPRDDDGQARAADRRAGKGERRDKRDLERARKMREEAERRAAEKVAADRAAAERAAAERATAERTTAERVAAEKVAAEKAAREQERQARDQVKALLAKGKQTLADKGYTSVSTWPDAIREAYDEAKRAGTDVAKASAFEIASRVPPAKKAGPPPASSSKLDLEERLAAMKRCLPAKCAQSLLGEYTQLKKYKTVSASKRKTLEAELRDCELVCRAQR